MPVEWIPIAVASIAGLSAVIAQAWANRGEPAAIKRIKLLSEAIVSMPETDAGAQRLAEARTKMAARLAASLIGVSGVARFFRVVGWPTTVIGSLIFAAWVVLAMLNPSLAMQNVFRDALNVGLTLIIVGSVSLVYSAIWPQFDRAMDSLFEVARQIVKERGSREPERAPRVSAREDHRKVANMEPLTDDSASWTWMSDDPLDEPRDDPRWRYFDRTAFVSTISEAINRARSQSTSSVFGLIGSWGSGKSTVITSLSRHLKDSNWRVHHFNPWLYSDADSLKWGFFSDLRGAVPAGDQWNDARKNLGLLRDAVIPLAALANVFGPDFGSAAKHLFDPNRLSATKMRDKVAEQLEGLLRPVLIVLDDLDRLSSAELLEVFKLVRFTGRLPNVYYLLCYDEHTLVDLLEKTDLVGERNDRRALDYLEKIVQLRFDIPPLREDLVEELFEIALNGVVQKSGGFIAREDESRLVELQRSGLVGRLTTPRAIRHLFAQLEAFLPSVLPEVNLVDFVLVTWVRTFEPGLYAQLQTERAFLLHGNTEFEFDKKKALEVRKQRLADILSRAKVAGANLDTVQAVLQALFPIVRKTVQEQDYSGSSGPGSQRISDEYYFDRYFNFGVPNDDLPDATVRDALGELTATADEGSTQEKVEAHLRSHPRRTIQKLDRERERNPEQSAALVHWSLQMFSDLPEQHGWGAPRDLLTQFLAELLSDADEGQYPIFSSAAFGGGTETAYMLLDASRTLVGRSLGDGNEIKRWNARGELLQGLALRELPSFLEGLTARPILEIEGYARSLFVLLGILDPSGAKALVERRIEQNIWVSLDVVAFLVGSSVPSGSGPDVTPSISELDPAWINTFIDLEKARLEAAQQIDTADNLSELHRADATPSNRRAYVLAWFKAHSVDDVELSD